jgi:PKHD-type hydroxylase
MRNLWELWPQGLSDQYCDYIINCSQRHEPQTATVGFEASSPAKLGYRSSTIRWLDVEGINNDIAETLMRFVRMSNRNNFGFDITKMNEIQFTEYHGSANGKYDWHHDVHWENPAPYDRKLSIVVQLSSPDDYEGGEFEFFDLAQPVDFKKRGSVLVFPSFFLHRVLPVTSGTRYSLVSWIEGPKWR